MPGISQKKINHETLQVYLKNRASQSAGAATQTSLIHRTGCLPKPST